MRAGSLVFALLCGACGASKMPVRAGAIAVLDAQGNGRAAVDFGRVQVGVVAVEPLRIRNGGLGALTVSHAVVADGGLAFGVRGEWPLVIAPNTEAVLELSFLPVVAGSRSLSTLVLRTDDPAAATVSIGLSGTGLERVVVFTPSSLEFGEVYTGESKRLDFTMLNAGSATLTLLGASVVDAGFDITALPLGLLAGGAHLSGAMTFIPLSFGDAVGGAMVVRLDGGTGFVSLPLSGRSVQSLPELCFRVSGSVATCSNDVLTVKLADVGSFFVRNRGNARVAYALQFDACDGGFVFSNAPAGGVSSWAEPTVSLPSNVTDPKPWESAPIAVALGRASSCTEAQVRWVRQGEPTRAPASMGAVFH